MEFYYELTQSLNGDITLKKAIIDKTNYTIEEKENGCILLKKIVIITINDANDIKNYDFKKSTILSCLINNNDANKLKYKSILEQIYELINDGTKIIKNTKINIKTIKKEDEGFYHMDNIGISIQSTESNKTISEIVNQCTHNGIKMVMKIKLNCGITINICI